MSAQPLAELIRDFYIDRVKMDYFRHRGQASNVEASIALANSGDLQIELIQQRNDAPSMYKETVANEAWARTIAFLTEHLQPA